MVFMSVHKGLPVFFFPFSGVHLPGIYFGGVGWVLLDCHMFPLKSCSLVSLVIRGILKVVDLVVINGGVVWGYICDGGWVVLRRGHGV